MGGHQPCTPLAQRVQSDQHIGGRGGIQPLGRLIQQPQGALLKQQPGQCQAAGLAGRQPQAAFAQSHVQPGLQTPYGLGQSGRFQGLPQCGVISVRVGQAQVVAQAVLEQVRTLVQPGAGLRQDAPGVRLALSGDQRHQCRLACAAGADHGDPFARGQLQRQCGQCIHRAIRMADRYVIHDDRTARVGAWGGGLNGRRAVGRKPTRRQPGAPRFESSPTQRRKGFHGRQRNQ